MGSATTVPIFLCCARVAGLGVVSAETVPRMLWRASFGVLSAEAEAPDPIRVPYRWVLGLAPVLVGTIGVEATGGWNEVETVWSIRGFLRGRGKVSGDCT